MSLDYVIGHPYFSSCEKAKKQYPYLTESIQTEVIIIGGGVTGGILGYYFSKANIPAVLLEKKRIAHASSSISTCLLQYELDSPASELVPYIKKEDILLAYRLGKQALSQLDDFIKEYGNDSCYAQRDCLLYTCKKDSAPVLEAEYQLRKDAGFEVEYITKENNPFLFDIEGGILSINGGAEVDPFQYTHQLLEVSKNAGLKIYENTAVENVTYNEDSVLVETEYGNTVSGKIVILATGYDTDAFSSREFGTKTVSYNIVTNPLENLDDWYHRCLIRDFCDPYNYYRTTMDNRIIAGGQDVPYVQNINNVKQAELAFNNLITNIHRIYPKEVELHAEYKYRGGFASTQDNVGFIGPDPKHKNLWYCLGYGANGTIFSLLGGDMLSRKYLGEEDENLRLFRVNRFD